MKNKNISDVVLVYDRYYSNKPNPVLLSAKRVLLCCAVTLCAVMFVLTQYKVPISPVMCAVVSVLFAAAFSVLFIFVKKRFAIPGILLISGAVIWLTWKTFWDKITYFFDYICLVMDGRFFSGRFFINHNSGELSLSNPDFISGITLGTVLLIMVFSMITAAGMFVKPHTLPSFLTWIVLWVPLFISERFTFNWWIVPAIAVYMGAFAMSIAYREGLTLKSGKGGSYSNAAALNERNFMNRLAKSSYTKRVEMISSYYSKYFSLTMYAAAVFAAIGIVTSVVLRDSQGLDYTKIYEFVMNIGKSDIFDRPFDSGSMEGYFTKPFDESSSLSINSPGKSTREILKVTNPGSVPVYLRGDYGITFSDKNWSSPISAEPYWWNVNKRVLDNYRPVEMRILQSVLQRGADYDDTVENIEITVDYLCDTDVVFLPAYTEEFSYYDNSMLKIYGDFVARLRKSDKIDSIECTALVAKYSNCDRGASQSDLEYLRRSIEAVDEWDFKSVMNSFLSSDDLVNSYNQYIYNTFLGISDEKRQFMIDYMRSAGLESRILAIQGNDGITKREKDYLTADLICTYLMDNFTYSIDENQDDGDIIEMFLTETKRGHCALYATSMTLMMRTLGIPARYCTGFVAPPNGSVPTILRSRNLHAWCEIYLDELGWVTFDPTAASLFSNTPGNPDNSSAESNSSDSDSSSDQSSNSSSSDQDSSSSDNGSSLSGVNSQSGSSGERDSSNDGQQEQSVNFLPYIIILSAAAAVAVAAVIIFRAIKSLEKRARKSVRRLCRERKAVIILNKIITLLEIGGLTPKNGEMPDQFYRRAEKTLRCAFSANKDMLEAVAFGNKNFTDIECEGLSRLLEQLYNALEAKLDIFDKVKLWRSVL